MKIKTSKKTNAQSKLEIAFSGIMKPIFKDTKKLAFILSFSLLLILQSCSPKIKLNSKGGQIQIDNNIELRANPKKFKSKEGPVNITWFVNGIETSTGESFLFSTPKVGQYVIRAEARQGAKKAEKQINFNAGLFDPRLVDLVNGTETFPVQAEKPLTKINSKKDTLPMEITKKEEGGIQKEVRTVWTEEKQTYSASKNPDEFVMFDPNANVLWPGALVQGKSVASGVPAIIPISTKHRLPGKVTLSILSGDGKSVQNKFYRESEMTKSRVTQALNDILAGYKGGTPAQYSYSKSTAYSSTQVQFDLSMGYSGPANKVDGKLGVNWSQNKSRMVVKLYQKFFTMTYDDPQGVSGVFRPSISYNDLQPYAGAGNPACYVSSVTYGRMYVLLYESSESQLDLEAALNYAYDGVVAEGYVESELKSKFKNGSTSVKAFQVGGDGAKGLEASIDPLNPEKIRKFIVEGANFSSTNPGEIISYTVNYLKDASLVRMNSAMEYTVTQRSPLSSEEFILIPAITNKSKEVAEANLRKESFSMNITGSIQDCNKNPGTVISQSPQPGTLAKAGSPINVQVIADRPTVSAPEIGGAADRKVLSPEQTYTTGAWALADTSVAFALEGDKCTTGKVVINHPLWGVHEYTLNAGQKKTATKMMGLGDVTIRLISSNPKARLYVRVW